MAHFLIGIGVVVVSSVFAFLYVAAGFFFSNEEVVRRRQKRRLRTQQKVCAAVVKINKQYWNVRDLAMAMEIRPAKARAQIDWLLDNHLIYRHWQRESVQILFWTHERRRTVYYTVPDQELLLRARGEGLSATSAAASILALSANLEAS